MVVGQLGGMGGPEIERHLGILGVSNSVISHDYDKICRSLDAEKADVLLCDMTVSRAQAHAMMHDVRNQDLGSNPFLVMIGLTEHMTKEDTQRAVDTGADDLVLAPFNRDVFVRRINEIAWNRRKFVAVSSYVGPTRRTGARPGRTSAEEFDVPNPVRSTGTGVPKETLWKEIRSAAKSLHARKLNTDIAMIRELVNEIVPDYEMSDITETFRRRIELLQSSVVGVHKRAERLGFWDLVSLCEIAANVVTEIKERPVPPNLRHLRALPKMVAGFETALLSMREAIAAAN